MFTPLADIDITNPCHILVGYWKADTKTGHSSSHRLQTSCFIRQCSGRHISFKSVGLTLVCIPEMSRTFAWVSEDYIYECH